MSGPARIVFAGTPDFAVPALQALHDAGAAIVAVYTQPDRPAGRGRRVQPSPVKRWALEHAVPVEQPETLKDLSVQQQLSRYDADLMVVAAYGLLLPPAVLAIPRLGCVNIHASLLPRWRGAAPIQRAILAGDAQTGISLMQMEAGLDTGPVLARAATDIGAGETAAELHDRLAALGGELAAGHLPAIVEGRLSAEPQNAESACHAAKLSKSEAWLDWAQPASQLDRQVRAFNPRPVAQTGWNGKVLRIWRAHPLDTEPGAAVPGQVIGAGADGVDVACGRGVLRVTQMQLPGGRAMSVAQLVNAHSFDGTIFDPRPPAPDTRVRA